MQDTPSFWEIFQTFTFSKKICFKEKYTHIWKYKKMFCDQEKFSWYNKYFELYMQKHRHLSIDEVSFEARMLI